MYLRVTDAIPHLKGVMWGTRLSILNSLGMILPVGQMRVISICR
jgi:hypothetical protein